MIDIIILYEACDVIFSPGLEKCDFVVYCEGEKREKRKLTFWVKVEN